MMTDHKLDDEQGRLAALERYEVLDTEREQPFEKITNLVQTVMDVPIAAVTLIDLHRQWFKSLQGLDVTETSRQVAFCDHTIRQREPLVIPDATKDPRFAENPLVAGEPYIRAYAGVPLETPDGYNLGALCAIDRKPRDFDANQIAILSSFAKLVVDELELRQIASTDSLTGALTRRGFIESVNKEISRSTRYDRPAAIAMFDIDYFKKINDTYGHPAGDEVLRNVATCVGDDLRENDVLARLGGEEFAIFMPETPLHQAVDCAERLREKIANLTVPHEKENLSVTVSFGVAPLTARYNDAEAWLAAVDQALYVAKTSGRNRTEKAHGLDAAEVKAHIA